MDTIQTLSVSRLQKSVYGEMTIFGFFLAVVALFPMFSHSQFITGPIVNATLFLSTVFLGPVATILLSVVSSPIALLTGTLPIFLAPMIPFIILGNIALVIVFQRVRERNFFGAVVLASMVKFGILFGISMFLMPAIVPDSIARSLSLMMGLPQLLTALLGGFIAFLGLSWIRKF